MIALFVASVCLFWYVGCAIICTIGYCQIYRYYRARRTRGISERLDSKDIPHVTIIRPIKGLEPDLYQCLAATFKQTYPQSSLTTYFCLQNRSDPATKIAEQVLVDHPNSDAKILFEDEDPVLQSNPSALGPNPKIRNVSRAYREAKGDIIWIIDCNVWVATGVAGRMVDLLCGFSRFGTSKPYKFVHQLPLVVDVTDEQDGLLSSDSEIDEEDHAVTTSTSAARTISPSDFSSMTTMQRIYHRGGGRLEELFLASAHAKWYTAINTILLAPCIVGKSNMFRRSHLAELTARSTRTHSPTAALTTLNGIDFFSDNICEDHLIGDLLWKGSPTAASSSISKATPVPQFGNHALLPGDPAIQPMAAMNIAEYIARRVRWLRVRKFTVTLATFVEPGTESGFCSCVGAWAVTSPSLPFFHYKDTVFSIPQTWTAFALFWLCSVTVWALVDATLYRILHSMASVEIDEDTPAFVRRRVHKRRPIGEWALAWLGREVLTLPIWVWAVWGGVTVVWRGQKFRVGMDMRVKRVGGGGMKSGGVYADAAGNGVGGIAVNGNRIEPRNAKKICKDRIE